MVLISGPERELGYVNRDRESTACALDRSLANDVFCLNFMYETV